MSPAPNNGRLIKTVLGAVLATVFLASSAQAADRFEQVGTSQIPVPDGVSDIAVAADGSYTFVLTARGEVVIYDAAGRLIQTMTVGSGYDRLEYDNRGSRLFLGGSGQKNLKIISLAMRYGIDTESSPYRGPEDAPVTIAVFDDFQ